MVCLDWSEQRFVKSVWREVSAGSEQSFEWNEADEGSPRQHGQPTESHENWKRRPLARTVHYAAETHQTAADSKQGN